jgi:hypothetical protein
MEKGWLAREVERTERIISAMPGGWESVQEASRRADEDNRDEAEAYRREQELRMRKGSIVN